MVEVFALIVAGGLTINMLSAILSPPTVQICVPYVTEEGVQATACRKVRDTGQGQATTIK